MGIRGGERGDIYRQSENSDQEKRMGKRGEREEKADAFSPENMSYLRDGEGKRGQAGQREERRAFFSRQQNFLQQLLATSQALFFSFGFQKELAGGVVNLFPM